MLPQMALCIFNKREQARAAVREPGEGGAGTGGFRGVQASSPPPTRRGPEGFLLGPGPGRRPACSFACVLAAGKRLDALAVGGRSGGPEAAETVAVAAQGPS